MNKRRLLEWVKSLLILLLSVSALCLLVMTPLVQDSGLTALFSSRRGNGGADGTDAALADFPPVRVAVMAAGGRRGIQYDRAGVEDQFFGFSSLLGDGLASAREAEPLTSDQWEQKLSRIGIYFDFDRHIPLTALCAWLQPEGSCSLTASARRILLARGEEDRVLLCYEDGSDGQFYSCVTDLSAGLHLEPAVASAGGGEAYFAYESEKLSALLLPYTLITEQESGQIWAAADPFAGEVETEAAVKALDISVNNRVAVAGGTAYPDGTARLEVGGDGTFTYSDGHEGKFPVAAEGKATVTEMIRAARALADRTLGAYCGEAELCLDAAYETEEGWVIRFCYRIDGSEVWLYEEGWAARFLIREGFIREFTLHFRSYEPTEERALLLPMDRAAVLLPGLTAEPRELTLRYTDRGGELLTPGWVAR